MSHVLATVRHDGRRPSVTPGAGGISGLEPRRGGRILAWGVSPRIREHHDRQP